MRPTDEVLLLKSESITGVTTAEVAAMLQRFAARWKYRALSIQPCMYCQASCRSSPIYPVCRKCWDEATAVPF